LGWLPQNLVPSCARFCTVLGNIVEQVITAQEVEITGDLLMLEFEFQLSREVERWGR